MFSIGLRSGLWTGHVFSSIFFSFKDLLYPFCCVTWSVVLHEHSGVMNAKKEPYVVEEGSETFAFTLPCICIRGPTHAAGKHVSNHEFILNLSLTLCTLWVQSCSSLSPYIMFLSDPNKLNLLSSLKWNWDQFSSVHTTCSSAKLSWAFWFYLLMRGLVTAEWAFSPKS